MASLAAAKRRRGPALPNGQNITTPLPSTPAPANSGQLSISQAMSLLGTRINKLETTLTTNMGEVENKFGQQDNYIVENLPDIDAINVAFEDINKRLLSVESGTPLSSNTVVSSGNNATMSLSLANMEKEIQSMNAANAEKMDFIEQSISSLDNTTKVVFLESNVNKLISEVAELKSTDFSPITPERISNLEEKFGEINLSSQNDDSLIIGELSTRVDNLENMSNDDQILELSNKVQTLENISYEDQFNMLLNRIEALENTYNNDVLNTINERIAALEKLEERLSALESS